MTDELQAAHARAFGITGARFLASAAEFARQVAGTFSPTDVAKLYLAASVSLIPRDEGVALLRELADALEAGEDRARPN